MGICKKCKKKTDLYCFKHKQTICAACLSSNENNEHATCYVGSYSDFLHLSAEEVSKLVEYSCPTCSEGFNESQHFFRLPCLHLIHQDCLQKVISELPADTARGGFVCPKCNKPIFSSGDVSGDFLASALYNRLHDLPWAEHLLATISAPTEAVPVSSSPAAEVKDSPSPQPEAEKPKEESSASNEEDKHDSTKPSASSLFIQQSQNKGEHPPVSPRLQQQQHKRSTVATGVPGVGLFVPPPPPKSQPVDTLPVNGSVLSNLPLSDRVDSEEGNGEEFLNIQIPPLGSRLASRKALPLGGDYGSNRYYSDDDDDDKNHHSALAQVISYFGLAKRVNGKTVIDKTKVVIVCAVLLFVVFIFVRVFMPSQPANKPDADDH